MPQAETVDRPPRLPLVVAPSNRNESTDKDARLVNCYVESNKALGQHEYWLYGRPGLLVHTTLSGAGQGVYNWLGDIYAIFGTHLYKNGVSVGTVDATGGVYQFDSCLGGTPKLILGNGVKAYTYDGGAGLVEITDGDFVKPFCKGWAYLDGTTYYMTATDAAIRGSDINDPQAWDPLNKILAQIEPDRGVGLNKQLVYVIAFKQWTTEIFYDAANPTGSPLGRVEGAKINYGCTSMNSVQDCDGDLIYMASNRSAATQIVMVSNLKAKVVSTKPIERLLNGADFTTIFSWQFNDNGHRFYGITIKSSNITLVYDLAEDMWSQWTDTDGNYFPMVAATFVDDGTGNTVHIFQGESDGKLYTASSELATDNGDLIQIDIYTPNFDAGIRHRKFLTMMTIIADQTTGSSLYVRVSDDDYQTWTNFRRIDLGQKLPRLTDCGSFYRRAHHFRHKHQTRMRLQAVELQYDIGTL